MSRPVPTYWRDRARLDYRPPPDVLRRYIHSHEWYAIRNAYKSKGLPRCCLICGKGRYDLHHTNYRRLGREPAISLRPLCRDHHTELHQYLNRYSVPLAETDSALRALAARYDPVGFEERIRPFEHAAV